MILKKNLPTTQANKVIKINDKKLLLSHFESINTGVNKTIVNRNGIIQCLVLFFIINLV